MRCNKFCLILVFSLLLISFSFVSASQNFLDKKVSYEYGKFTPETRQGEELNNYFKKLEIPEDEIYVLLEFNEAVKNRNLRELKRDGVEEIGSYGKGIYVYKFPKEILESKSYDFIKWINVPKKWDKMNNELKESLDLNNSLYVKINFYEIIEGFVFEC